MSRYPGTQFILNDQSNVSAAVPIQSVSNLAPVYMTTFRAPKGSESMLSVSGQRFYNMYGSQDKIKFNTYKQPLLQASMDINEGAKLIAKRAVLDSAKLANATVGVVLSKYKEAFFTKAGEYYKCDTAATGADTNNYKYVLRPVVLSVEDTLVSTSSSFEETKYQYLQHRNNINSIVEGTKEFEINTGITGTFEAKSVIPLNNAVYSGDTSTAGKIKNGNASQITWNDPTASLPEDTPANEAKQKEHFAKVYEATVCGEYFFPLFTIFDNGRGSSLKNYSIVFDINTAKSIGTAVYTLKISDSETGRTLESFAFTINPYTRNSNTGYTFDIESAVNLKSDQVFVKYHYDSYDRLISELATRIGTDEYVFDKADCLFGYKLSGNLLDNGLVHSGLADLYCVSTSDSNNLDGTTSAVKYYFYNYNTRYKQNISERLLYGDDGIIDRDAKITTVKANNTKTGKVYKDTASTTDDIILTADVPCPVVLKSSATVDTQRNKIKSNRDFISQVLPDLNWGTLDEENSTNTVLKFVKSNGDYTEISMTVTAVGPEASGNYPYTYTVTVNEYTWEASYQNQYRKFFNGNFDRDIFNLDVWFPNLVFDANYDKPVKLAIQKLAAFRGDFFVYLDMNTDVKSLEDVRNLVQYSESDVEFPVDERDATKFYIHDRNCGVTPLYGDIRDPYTNKQITVTATYVLSLIMVKHYINGSERPFAGQGNGITFGGYIEGTVNYIPKIYPGVDYTSRSFIGNTYPSDDQVIINEKQQMTDLKVNYGSYYNGVLTMDTEFTLNSTDSEFSYINNIMQVHSLMQAIRKSCPISRYKFIDGDDLSTYQKAVEEVLKVNRRKFASLKFKYVQDENSVANKIYYAAIEVVFRPFAQAEIFTITALNYSTLSSDVATV